MAPTSVPDQSIAFRHEPPELNPAALVRPRLIEGLRGRFDRRLTVITAGAGFGKTTLLAQAVHENRIERLGLDAWLRISAPDRDPQHLFTGLLRSISGSERVRSGGLDDVVAAVWAAAPESMALVLDDAHVLGDSEPAWAALRELLEVLPANGHLVLAGRTRPSLSLGRLQLEDAVLIIDEATMGYTPEELRSFGEQRGLVTARIAELPPWPALASLMVAAGHRASSDFVWEEVLARLPPWQRRLLALASAFDVIDDVLLAALDPDGHPRASELVAGVPLVQGDGLGSYRLHGLWAAALRDEVDGADRRRTLAAAAGVLLEAGAFRRAAEAAALAGDTTRLRQALCRFACQPIASVSVPDVIHLASLLPAELRQAPIGRLLEAARYWESSARQARVLFDRAGQLAQAAGDDEVEALARWRIVQLDYLDDQEGLAVDPRLDELARSGVPLARSSPAFIRSVQAQREGRIGDALAALDDLDDTDLDQLRETIGVRLFDLGRPEGLPATVESILDPHSANLFAAQAMWLRGDIDPETGWAIGRTFPGVAGRQGVLHELVSMRCIIANVALCAGEVDEAADLVARARASYDGVGRQIQLTVLVLDALLALQRDGDEAAAEALGLALDLVPLGLWPARPYLYALAPLRVLRPELGPVLDGCDLGPALRGAVAAGAALATLRRDGDPRSAAKLDWRAANLLRAHVPPPHLVELALAAAVAGEPAAEDVLRLVPDLRRWLQRIARVPRHRLAPAAAARLAGLPARPGYDLIVTTLGSFTVRRSDGVPLGDGWAKRERVRQVLAQLIGRRSVSRRALAATLWPAMDADKAAANLRVNLSYLQGLLQPGRAADEPPWFVRTEGDLIALATEGVVLDSVQFEEHLQRAVEAEAAGLPSVALAEYALVGDLFGGDHLSEIDDEQIDLDRLRLRALAHAATCRRGELTLAKGEPEAAMRAATEALRLDPLSERAHRLFIRSQLAIGSATTARAAAARLLDALAAADLRPDDETLLLLRRLDLDGDRDQDRL